MPNLAKVRFCGFDTKTVTVCISLELEQLDMDLFTIPHYITRKMYFFCFQFWVTHAFWTKFAVVRNVLISYFLHSHFAR